jgi:hypothetical protein
MCFNIYDIYCNYKSTICIERSVYHNANVNRNIYEIDKINSFSINILYTMHWIFMESNREQQIVIVLDDILKHMENSLDALVFSKGVFRTTSYNLTRLEIIDSINDTVRILIPAIAKLNSDIHECQDCK